MKMRIFGDAPFDVTETPFTQENSSKQIEVENTLKTNLFKNFKGLLAKHYPSISEKWKWEALVSTLYFLERRTCQKLL